MHTDIELAQAVHARMQRDGLTQRQVAEAARVSLSTVQRTLIAKVIRPATRKLLLDWLAKDSAFPQPPITRDAVAVAIHRAGPIAREVALAAIQIESKHARKADT